MKGLCGSTSALGCLLTRMWVPMCRPRCSFLGRLFLKLMCMCMWSVIILGETVWTCLGNAVVLMWMFVDTLTLRLLVKVLGILSLILRWSKLIMAIRGVPVVIMVWLAIVMALIMLVMGVPTLSLVMWWWRLVISSDRCLSVRRWAARLKFADRLDRLVLVWVRLRWTCVLVMVLCVVSRLILGIMFSVKLCLVCRSLCRVATIVSLVLLWACVVSRDDRCVMTCRCLILVLRSVSAVLLCVSLPVSLGELTWVSILLVLMSVLVRIMSVMALLIGVRRAGSMVVIMWFLVVMLWMNRFWAILVICMWLVSIEWLVVD